MYSGGGGFRQCVDLFGQSFINKQLRACGEGAGYWALLAAVQTALPLKQGAQPESTDAATRANQKRSLRQTVAKLII